MKEVSHRILKLRKTPPLFSGDLTNIEFVLMFVFRGNKKVCEDWFARMRPSLMLASVISSTCPDIIRHAMQRISDLRNIALHGPLKDPKRFSSDLESALIYLGIFENFSF
jgi:hypothetical protein